MVKTRKHKTKIILLSILIIGLHIFFTANMFSMFFSMSGLITTGTERFIFINYFSSGVAQIFSLLIVPVTTIILLNVKEIDLEKRYLISRVLVGISMPVTLINAVLFNFFYWTFATFYWVELWVWGPFISFAIVYFVEFLLSLTVFLLLRLKKDKKKSIYTFFLHKGIYFF